VASWVVIIEAELPLAQGTAEVEQSSHTSVTRLTGTLATASPVNPCQALRVAIAHSKSLSVGYQWSELFSQRKTGTGRTTFLQFLLP